MSWQTAADTRLANGLRIVVLSADATPVVESRLVLIATGGLDAGDLIRRLDVTAARTVPGLTVTAESVGDLPLVLASSVPDRFEDVARAFAGILAGHPHRPASPGRARTEGHRRGFWRDVLSRRLTGRSAGPAEGPRTAHIRPRPSLLIVAGPIDAATAIRAAGRHLGTVPADVVPIARPRSRVHRPAPPQIVGDPEAEYATMLATAPAPYPGDQDFAAVLMAAELVGGGSQARLHRALGRRYPGVVNATCTVEHDATGAWLALRIDVTGARADLLADAALHALGTAVRRPPTAAEWATAKAGVFQTTVAAQAGTAQTATSCARAAAYGLPPAFWLSVPRQLHHLGASEVAAAARRYLAPEHFTTAVPGLTSRLHPCEGKRR
ncbi:insulinase family protein [Actinoplanes sp. NEAU-A12]|uniref:Insulinase family protein n=1 Tax=Actinoplanes sandaracinus TaxID=3045177 RepID=A0ABT6WHE2_9ACTN|nr:insulinase family protein [Actinoplanes sandaracinus]MDI6099136.1 insulinase family protein [Actinoplanes sandaracinus]